MIHPALQQFRATATGANCNHLVGNRGQRKERRRQRKGTSNPAASASSSYSAGTSSTIQQHLLTSLQNIDGVADRKCDLAGAWPPGYPLIAAYYAYQAHYDR
jgi:hypothetical protein